MKSSSKRFAVLAAGAALLAASGAVGYLTSDSAAQRVWATGARHKWTARLLPPDERRLPSRFQVNCAVVTASHPFVIAAFGQSNSANYGQQRYVPVGPVYDLMDGRCFLAQDPLLGSTGHGGSVWTRLADRLIAHGYAPAVVLVSFGVSASEIARWAPGGDLNGRIPERLGALAALGLAPDVVLFHQGETDAKRGTSASNYADRLNAVVASVRRAGVEAPFLVAIASYCHGHASEDVTAAQHATVDPARGIYAGPDTDQLIGPESRFDGCHFSTAGLERAADLWFDALTEVMQPARASWEYRDPQGGKTGRTTSQKKRTPIASSPTAIASAGSNRILVLIECEQLVRVGSPRAGGFGVP